MTHVLVTQENCEEVAQQLVDFLKEKEFSIVSYFKGDRDQEPKGLSSRRIKSDYKFVNGVLTISLTPSRSITWDVKKEKVYLTYASDDMILIERIVDEKSSIFRMIVTH